MNQPCMLPRDSLISQLLSSGDVSQCYCRGPRAERMKSKSLKVSRGVDGVLFYSFLVPTLISLLAWWLNSSDRNPYGNSFPLLFDPFHSFTDWTITLEWSKQVSPWKYFGTLLENKLPPVFYGPSTFVVTKLNNIIVSPFNPRDLVIASQLFYFSICAVYTVLCLRIYQVVRNKVGNIDISRKEQDAKKNLILVPIFIMLSYPVVFAIIRGSSAIVASTFIAGYVLSTLIENHFWRRFCLVAATLSQFQLIPLALLSLMEKKRKSMVICLVSTASGYLAVVAVTGTNNILQTYKHGKEIFHGVTYMAHDLISTINILRNGSPVMTVVVTTLIIVLLSNLSKYMNHIYPVCFGLMDEARELDCNKNRELLACFALILVSCLVPNPSYAYHLTKLMPVLIPLMFVDVYRESRYFISAQGLLFSYIQLWGIFSDGTASVLRSIILCFDLLLTLTFLLPKHWRPNSILGFR